MMRNKRYEPPASKDNDERPRKVPKQAVKRGLDDESFDDESFDDGLHTVYDLIETRAQESTLATVPLVYYPDNGTNYIGYTIPEIHRLSTLAAVYYNAIVRQRQSSGELPSVVALLGVSSFDYFTSLLALSRLGHTLLLLSPRISKEAHVSLLRSCGAKHLFVDDISQPMAQKIQGDLPELMLSRIVSRGEYELSDGNELPKSGLNPLKESKNVAWIIHSSGSTNLPKPNYQTHAAALNNFKSQFVLTGFITMPLFHMQGLGCVFRSIMNRRAIYMYNARLPLLTEHLVATLRKHTDIQILYGVPYVMKLLADSEEGIAVCKKLEVLFSGGGACPKAVGDKLVDNGVYLVSHVGSSETGQLMNSYRPRSEIAEWDWLRPSAGLQTYLRWEPYDSHRNIFEMVVLDGWASKVATNRDDGAYATSDLWERHPEYPTKNAWRYYARKDDTIVLDNGEKANPIIFEDAAKKSPFITDAIVFGQQKPRLGMFLFVLGYEATWPSVLQEIWHDIEIANRVVPGHAILSKDMIRLFPLDKADEVKRTDKSSIIRSRFYKDFASLIDATYDELPGGSLRTLDEPELRAFLTTEVRALMLDERLIDSDRDLFSMGMDSLQALRLRSSILKHIDIGAAALPETFVFEQPSIHAMSMELIRMRKGDPQENFSPVRDRMAGLIDKYSNSFPRQHGNQELSTHVLVTGATGSLGAHIIAQLAQQPDLSQITCLVRAASNEAASHRVQNSLRDRRLAIKDHLLAVFAVDFSKDRLGLSDQDYAALETVTDVIHAAWNVNFNLSLNSFEHDCIGGTRRLIDLCARSRSSKPPSFAFCSSVSSAANIVGQEVPEEPCQSLEWAQNIGYARSKLVGEKICEAAAKHTGLKFRILRIGQIVGDTQFGIWNIQEAIPNIIQGEATIGAMPLLDEPCSWLPVDVVARAVVDLSISRDICETPLEVFNIVNVNPLHWTGDVLPMLKEAGLDFQEVSPDDWLQRLEHFPDPVNNPPYKLINFFKSKYGTPGQKRAPIFRSEKARERSSALRHYSKPDQELINKMVRYILKARE